MAQSQSGTRPYSFSNALEESPTNMLSHIRLSINIKSPSWLKFSDTSHNFKALKLGLIFFAKKLFKVTAGGGPGDIVASREFVLVSKEEYKGDTWVQG